MYIWKCLTLKSHANYFKKEKRRLKLMDRINDDDKNLRMRNWKVRPTESRNFLRRPRLKMSWANTPFSFWIQNSEDLHFWRTLFSNGFQSESHILYLRSLSQYFPKSLIYKLTFLNVSQLFFKISEYNIF